MLDVTRLLIAEVVARLERKFQVMFGDSERQFLHAATSAVDTALSHIAASNALYHNVEHTVHVTLVGIEILHGRHVGQGDVTRRDWLNTVVALLCHDIGYVRGILGADGPGQLSTGVDDATVKVASGKSDAVLMPIHVDRGKCFVTERGFSPLIQTDAVRRGIERTRFPVPADALSQVTDDYPGLVRAADLIGQLSDPRYLHKLAAVFYEFEETGYNANMGYSEPGDLLQAYPRFFARNVQPYIGAAENHLRATQEGRDILDNLYGNLDQARRLAPDPRPVTPDRLANAG